MSASLHAIFNVRFGNIYFVILVLNIRSRQKLFSARSQFISEESNCGHNEVIYLKDCIFFQCGGGLYFLLLHSKRNILTKKWTLYLVSTKISPISRKRNLFLVLSDFLGPASKSVFLIYRQKNEKMLSQFPGGGCWDHRVRLWDFDFWPAWGGVSRFASQFSEKTVVLVSCNSIGRHFVAFWARYFWCFLVRAFVMLSIASGR